MCSGIAPWLTAVAVSLANSTHGPLPPLCCRRLVDQRGMPVGPHRVWLSTSWVPGLAMSRAMGDMVAQSVGVTSGARSGHKRYAAHGLGPGEGCSWPPLLMRTCSSPSNLCIIRMPVHVALKTAGAFLAFL